MQPVLIAVVVVGVGIALVLGGSDWLHRHPRFRARVVRSAGDVLQFARSRDLGAVVRRVRSGTGGKVTAAKLLRLRSSARRR